MSSMINTPIPCPFCDGDSIYCVRHGVREKTHYVERDRCGAKGNQYAAVHDYIPGERELTDAQARALAISTWNDIPG